MDTRDLAPSRESTEKEVFSLTTVKSEPGSLTSNKLLHGILSQQHLNSQHHHHHHHQYHHHQQQSHGVVTLQNSYSRIVNQAPYSTATIPTTNTPGKNNKNIFFSNMQHFSDFIHYFNYFAMTRFFRE